MPFTTVIAPDGKVLYRWEGEENTPEMPGRFWPFCRMPQCSQL
jgi:hypothetical protein